MQTALEHILTSCYKTEMITYMDSHPEEFEEAIRLAVSNKPRYSWRAAWLLWSCMKENDQRIQKHISSFIEALTTVSDNQLRELLMILQRMELNEEYEGKVFDHCVKVWEKIDKKPSVRFNALKMIVKIAHKYPELTHEVVFLIQDHYLDSLSSGVKHSVSIMMKDFRNINT